MKRRVPVKKYMRNEDVILRISCLKYAYRHSNKSEAAEMYGVSRGEIYEWERRYDGTDASVQGGNRASTRKHSKQELQMIMKSFEEQPELTQKERYLKLKEQGYKRSESGFSRICQKMRLDPALYEKAPDRVEPPFPPLRKVNEKDNPHKADPGDLLMPASCWTCEFFTPEVCIGMGTRLDNGKETSGMSIDDAIEMFPHGCNCWEISLDAFEEQEQMNGR